MTTLHDLYNISKQSPWVDNLSRSWLRTGRIQELKQLGIRGLTSNPTIFANAITHSKDYDDHFFALIPEMDTKAAYWEMACSDVSQAADILKDVYQSSHFTDGFVSIEVDPELAHNARATVEAAQWLWNKIDRENLMIKIPATHEGLTAITEVLARGISVNVTLIFGLNRYNEVMDAYFQGIHKARANGHNLEKIASVASFFVSRVDTKVDQYLTKHGPAGEALLGKTAVAQGQVAYFMNRQKFSDHQWSELVSSGATIQRPLWASTSTKNPSYPDLLYVESLIAPETVNTMPESTLLAFLDHGKVDIDSTGSLEEAEKVLDKLRDLGIDLDEVAKELENEGVDTFASSFKDLIAALEQKASTVR